MRMGISHNIGNGNGKAWKQTAWECEGVRIRKPIPGHLYILLIQSASVVLALTNLCHFHIIFQVLAHLFHHVLSPFIILLPFQSMLKHLFNNSLPPQTARIPSIKMENAGAELFFTLCFFAPPSFSTPAFSLNPIVPLHFFTVFNHLVFRLVKSLSLRITTPSILQTNRSCHTTFSNKFTDVY